MWHRQAPILPPQTLIQSLMFEGHALTQSRMFEGHALIQSRMFEGEAQIQSRMFEGQALIQSRMCEGHALIRPAILVLAWSDLVCWSWPGLVLAWCAIVFACMPWCVACRWACFHLAAPPCATPSCCREEMLPMLAA